MVVVDDHELLRAGTRRILDDATASPWWVKRETVPRPPGDCRHENRTSCSWTSGSRPTNGIDLARQIVTDYPDMTVLILSAYDDENYVRAALAAGVSGYLLKTMPSDELVRSITAACDGSGLIGSGVPPAAGRRPANPLSTNPLPGLTAREAGGSSPGCPGNVQQGHRPSARHQPATVEGHLNHVFDKLGTTSRTELVHYALANSLFVRERQRTRHRSSEP